MLHFCRGVGEQARSWQPHFLAVVLQAELDLAGFQLTGLDPYHRRRCGPLAVRGHGGRRRDQRPRRDRCDNHYGPSTNHRRCVLPGAHAR